MYNIEDFTLAAHNGDEIDMDSFLDYVRSFEYVILWGAGNLGQAIGKKFIEMNLPITTYWDIRAKDLVSANGINVLEPFTGNFDKAKTIVISCIVNGSSGGEWTKNLLVSNGYKIFINGMDIYEGLFCPINKKIGLKTKTCLNATMCNICACDRFINLLRNETGASNLHNKNLGLYFGVVTFIINQKCSLQCRYCGQYMNSYSSRERTNFPAERIKEDIDRFFDAVDLVGVVSIIGGEPFLHPEINGIVNHLLTKKNFGVINITTNGICKLRPEHLSGMQMDRLKISFSDYTKCLSRKQKDLFFKNVSLVESKGINYSIGVPIWTKPSPLLIKHHAVETMTSMKSNCEVIKLCMSVKNGKFYPCSKAEPIHCLGIADYKTDYVDITKFNSVPELRNKIYTLINRPYYMSCGHCSTERDVLLENAGEQGVEIRYAI